MRIVIDARMMYWTGVGRYTKRLLENLEQLDSANEYTVLVRRDDFKKWSPTKPNFKRVTVNINPYTIGEQLRLALILARLKPDLVHFTAPNTPLLYRGRMIVTVHDLTLLDFDTSRGVGLAKYLRGLKRRPYGLVFKSSVTRAQKIITDTKYVKEELVRRYAIDEKRIYPVMLGTDAALSAPEPIDKYELGKRFIFYAGNFFPYKNVVSTVRAFAKVVAKDSNVKLVLAGKPDFFQKELVELSKGLNIAGNVVFPGFVTDGELSEMYKRAIFYVNPSLSEGFGLQGLEAMAAGTPVTAARATCLPEVYGGAALYFDPKSDDDQAEKMLALLEDQALRQRLAELGRIRVGQFSWHKAAVETQKVYTSPEG